MDWGSVVLAVVIAFVLILAFSGDDNITNNFVNSENIYSYFETQKQDFMGNSNAAPFSNAAVGGGSFSTVTAIDIDHPGVVYMRDSTTVGGGYYIGTTSTSAYILTPGFSGKWVFQDVTSRTTTNIKLGFTDTTNLSTSDTDACVFHLDGGSNNLGAYCKNNSVKTVSTSNYTITNSKWYRAELYIISSNNVTFKLYNSSIDNTLLWEYNITTNIPSATAARATGFYTLVGESTTDAAANIIYLDYMELAYSLKLNR